MGGATVTHLTETYGLLDLVASMMGPTALLEVVVKILRSDETESNMRGKHYFEIGH